MTCISRTLVRSLWAGAFLLLAHGTANAQATRTWVSGVGDDANPCSRTAPCKTFAGAISKTAAGGEINAIDSAGYGTLNITKSITINGAGVHASVLNCNTTGMIINAAVTDVVVLRNLSFDGCGNGINGIRYLKAAALHLENVDIGNNNTASAGAGFGILANPTTGDLKLFLDNVHIVDNGNGAVGGGIYAQPVVPATVTVHITNSQIANNQGLAGLRVDGRVFATVRNSSITGNAQHGAVVVSTVHPADLAIHDSMVSGNGASAATSGAGIQTQGAFASARVKGTVITGNEVGVRALTSGLLASYGDNMLYGNSTDGTFTSTVPGL